MDDINSHNENNKTGDLNVKLSAGNDAIKYYDCTDNNFMFEIVSSDDEFKTDNDIVIDETDAFTYYDSEYEIEQNKCEQIINDGQIIVKSILDCGNHEVIEGVKINLYKINGLSPILIESKMTNKEGKVLFSDLEQGCYRVIEIINKKYFEKPKYINWNEITIDCSNKKQEVLVVNRIKKFMAKSKH